MSQEDKNKFILDMSFVKDIIKSDLGTHEVQVLYQMEDTFLRETYSNGSFQEYTILGTTEAVQKLKSTNGTKSSKSTDPNHEYVQYKCKEKLTLVNICTPPEQDGNEKFRIRISPDSVHFSYLDKISGKYGTVEYQGKNDIVLYSLHNSLNSYELELALAQHPGEMREEEMFQLSTVQDISVLYELQYMFNELLRIQQKW